MNGNEYDHEVGWFTPEQVAPLRQQPGVGSVEQQVYGDLLVPQHA